jgi:hypothetical protein
MPKNKGKGGKNRRRGKNENDILKRELVEKDGDNQGYFDIVFISHKIKYLRYSLRTSPKNAREWPIDGILL